MSETNAADRLVELLETMVVGVVSNSSTLEDRIKDLAKDEASDVIEDALREYEPEVGTDKIDGLEDLIDDKIKDALSNHVDEKVSAYLTNNLKDEIDTVLQGMDAGVDVDNISGLYDFVDERIEEVAFDKINEGVDNHLTENLQARIDLYLTKCETLSTEELLAILNNPVGKQILCCAVNNYLRDNLEGLLGTALLKVLQSQQGRDIMNHTRPKSALKRWLSSLFAFVFPK